MDGLADELGDQVIRYDDGHSAHLRHVPEFREYVKQNSRPDIVAKKNVRMALRALDGKIVRWPYEHINVCPFPTSLAPV